jgi:hypothetical protein
MRVQEENVSWDDVENDSKANAKAVEFCESLFDTDTIYAGVDPSTEKHFTTPFCNPATSSFPSFENVRAYTVWLTAMLVSSFLSFNDKSLISVAPDPPAAIYSPPG